MEKLLVSPGSALFKKSRGGSWKKGQALVRERCWGQGRDRRGLGSDKLGGIDRHPPLPHEAASWQGSASGQARGAGARAGAGLGEAPGRPHGAAQTQARWSPGAGAGAGAGARTLRGGGSAAVAARERGQQEGLSPLLLLAPTLRRLHGSGSRSSLGSGPGAASHVRQACSRAGKRRRNEGQEGMGQGL